MLEGRRRKHYSGLGHALDLRRGTSTITLVPDGLVADLLNYLNQADRDDEARKVVQIVEEMRDLESADEPVFTREDNMVLGQKPPAALKRTEKWKRYQNLEKREASLNRQLAQYRPRLLVHPVRRSVGGGGPSSPYWWVHWIVGSPKWGKRGRSQGHVSLGSGPAIQTILNFAQSGNLSRLRKCLQCYKWMYAKFRHQEFCSSKCQQQRYTQSPEWKAHRREYMRRYYHLTVSGKAKVKHRTKIKG